MCVLLFICLSRNYPVLEKWQIVGIHTMNGEMDGWKDIGCLDGQMKGRGKAGREGGRQGGRRSFFFLCNNFSKLHPVYDCCLEELQTKFDLHMQNLQIYYSGSCSNFSFNVSVATSDKLIKA